ncbi:right-handed parallel beta-helix repeat-containing protein [Methanolapillus ohkumae]|uniref:right-handed parallel beta-helix repeat-containing protein n=1 Tax=Methanolapillus ohkumae TaxID=3028298 RepID=UPI0030B8DD1F
MILTETAAALDGDGSPENPYIISANEDLSGWTPDESDHIRIENMELLNETLTKALAGSTIYLVNGTYTISQYLISRDGITVTNIPGEVPVIQLTSKSNGFQITGNNTVIKNVTLDGNGIADYGFRARTTSGLIFDNVTAINMVKTAFDFNRVVDSSFTNLTAKDNGGFGITIAQGINLTVTGTTENNSWGGINVNNQEFGNDADIGTDKVNFTGVVNSEELMIILEEYNLTNTTDLVLENVNGPAGIDILNDSILISNDNGIWNSGKLIVKKYHILNPTNGAEESGQILSGILGKTNFNGGNKIYVPPGTYFIEDFVDPENIELILHEEARIIETLGEGGGIGDDDVIIDIEEISSSGGFGKAAVFDTVLEEMTENDPSDDSKNNTTPENGKENEFGSNISESSTSLPSAANQESEDNSSVNSKTKWSTYGKKIPTSIAIFILIVAAAVYAYYNLKPKDPGLKN